MIALIPGIFGEFLYDTKTNTNPDEKEIRTILRLVTISVAGLILYYAIAEFCGWPIPLYVPPGTYQRNDITVIAFGATAQSREQVG